MRRIFSLFWDILESATYAMAIFVVTYLFFFQPGIVHGNSSYPTWQEDDRFVSEKISYRLGSPSRGDFVVMQSPQNMDVDFIKRIVGLPGEQLSVRSCAVYINRIVLDESYLQPGTCTRPDGIWTIENGYYFVMGDNREGSSDSRVFGSIPRSSIVSKVVWRYWPLERLGKI